MMRKQAGFELKDAFWGTEIPVSRDIVMPAAKKHCVPARVWHITPRWQLPAVNGVGDDKRECAISRMNDKETSI
jgi:hypothetical protein